MELGEWLVTIAYNNIFVELQNYLARLQDKFLKPYLPARPEQSPSDYELDVMAYCVLSHAAIEGFVEQVAISVSSEAFDGFEKQLVVSDSLLSLSAYFKEVALPAASDSVRTCNDRLRAHLREVKQKYSGQVYENNGINIKYLDSLLIPIGIDVDLAPQHRDSLVKLVDHRGTYAHKGVGARRNLSPEDAAAFIKDCVEICAQIASKAASKSEKLGRLRSTP